MASRTVRTSRAPLLLVPRIDLPSLVRAIEVALPGAALSAVALRLVPCGLVLAGVGCNGEDPVPSPSPIVSEAGPSEGDQAEVLRLAHARSDALVARDEAALGSILDEHFVYTNAAGEVFDRRGYLDRYVRDPDVRWHAQELGDVEIRGTGETVILTARVHDRATFGEQELDAWFRSTFVYVKTDGDWRCVAGHSSSERPQ